MQSGACSGSCEAEPALGRAPERGATTLIPYSAAIALLSKADTPSMVAKRRWRSRPGSGSPPQFTESVDGDGQRIPELRARRCAVLLNGTSPRLDVKGHAAARPQRDTCDRVRPMPGDRIKTKGVNQNCQNDSRLDHRETGADADARPRAER